MTRSRHFYAKKCREEEGSAAPPAFRLFFERLHRAFSGVHRLSPTMILHDVCPRSDRSSGEILRRSRTAFQKDDDDETTTTKTTTTKTRFEPAKETFGFDGKSSSIQYPSPIVSCSGCVTSGNGVDATAISERTFEQKPATNAKVDSDYISAIIASLTVKASKKRRDVEKLCGFLRCTVTLSRCVAVTGEQRRGETRGGSL